jgi:hypothetical protein
MASSKARSPTEAEPWSGRPHPDHRGRCRATEGGECGGSPVDGATRSTPRAHRLDLPMPGSPAMTTPLIVAGGLSPEPPTRFSTRRSSSSRPHSVMTGRGSVEDTDLGSANALRGSLIVVARSEDAWSSLGPGRCGRHKRRAGNLSRRLGMTPGTGGRYISIDRFGGPQRANSTSPAHERSNREWFLVTSESSRRRECRFPDDHGTVRA